MTNRPASPNRRNHCSLAVLLVVLSVAACSADPATSTTANPDPTTMAPTTTVSSQPQDAGTAGQTMPWLHTEGTQIVDEDGAVVTLRGVNVEGWLMWQGSIWGAGVTTPETTIVNALTELSSAADVDRFRSEVFANFITEADVARIAELGANVIRLPFHYRILEDDDNPFVYKDEGWKLIDSFVDWCESNGIYVILDPHAMPGGQSTAFVADAPGSGLLGGTAELWDVPENRDRTIALWKAIATRYADRSVVAAYDLLAAPDPPRGREEELIDLYGDIIGAIRSVDPDHMVILHGTQATTNFAHFPGPLDSNQVYEPHQYTWFFGSPDRQVSEAKKQLDGWISISQEDGVPLWVGEFGENRYGTLEGTIELYETAGIGGWGFWLWKRTETRYPPLIEVPMPDTWRKVGNWIAFPSFPNARPSKSETVQGMADFVEAMKLPNCEENPEMVAVLSWAGRNG